MDYELIREDLQGGTYMMIENAPVKPETATNKQSATMVQNTIKAQKRPIWAITENRRG